MPPQDQKSQKQFWTAIISALIIQVVIAAVTGIGITIRLNESSQYHEKQIEEIKKEIKEIRKDVYQVRGFGSYQQQIQNK